MRFPHTYLFTANTLCKTRRSTCFMSFCHWQSISCKLGNCVTYSEKSVGLLITAQASLQKEYFDKTLISRPPSMLLKGFHR